MRGEEKKRQDEKGEKTIAAPNILQTNRQATGL